MDWRQGKALVTGGAVRIGRAICEALAARGCAVAVHYDRSGSEARALADDLACRGVAACAIQGHLQDGSSCEALVQEAWDALGGLNILVNNAAVFQRDSLLEVREDDLWAQIRTNAVIPILLSRGFVRRLTPRAAQPAGRIVNLLDQRVARQEAGAVPYLLSKKMLADFTRSAALEWAPLVTVNGIAPGAILPPVAPQDGRKFSEPAGLFPLGRQPVPGDVAAAVVGVLEQDAVTGQVLYVDGGQHLL
jgi:NAD(P)-dependent dehydrogenase (short-subunit alcohol dehydrogenase family)